MKKIVIFALIGFSLSLTSCLKENTATPCVNTYSAPTASATEIQNVRNYLAQNNIGNATQHSSGLFYAIVADGTGTAPGQCNVVQVNYTGRLTSGTIFDQSATPATFNLSELIPGWRVGIPLIKTGGKIRLYVPPSLGYGDRQVGNIPASSILIFDIDLVNVG